MIENILLFMIFMFIYAVFLVDIAQDVAEGGIPDKWHKKLWQWFTTLAITWMFGLLPSFIIFDIAGNPSDPFYVLAPLLGAFLAAAVGLFIRSRNSEDKPAAAT